MVLSWTLETNFKGLLIEISINFNQNVNIFIKENEIKSAI